jgi:hypothetical protein
MNGVNRSNTMRQLLMGLIIATLSFSWALATADARGQSGSRAATARSVGTNLRISNPFLLPGQDGNFPSGGDVAGDPDGFDLGDACIGSQVVRYLSGLGGVQPYAFTSANVGSFGLALNPSGKVTGTAVALAGSTTGFTAVLTDAASKTRTGFFRLNSLTYPPGTFRFAMDRLPTAQAGHDYITNLEAIGDPGNPPVFSVVAGSISLAGIPQTGATLETFGLTLFTDGTLAGRPLVAGTLTFTARAARGAQLASNRAGTAVDQPLSLTIEAETIVQSVLATSASSVKGTLNSTFRNKASFQFYLNTEGRSNAEFANTKFIFRFGGATFTTTLDAAGQSRSGSLRVKLDSTRGTMKVDLLDQDFGALFALSGVPGRANITGVVEIELGSTFIGTEAISFDTRVKNGRYDMHNRLGKERQLGGLFQIVALKAKDFGNDTAFKVDFLISHVKGNTTLEFGDGRNATVRIGPKYSQDITLTRNRGFAPISKTVSLKIDTKHKKGQLITRPLSSSDTGIPPGSSGQPQTFLLGIDVHTTSLDMSGEASRRIFPVVFRR